MTTQWLSTIEACQALGISQSTLRRRIDKGEIESKMEDGHRLILVITDNQMVTTGPDLTLIDQMGKENKSLKKQVEYLREQIQEKDKQIENLQTQLQDASQRHDTVVMQMTKMLEYHQQPFWRRWFKHKALPAPREDVMDMKPSTEEEATTENNSPAR